MLSTQKIQFFLENVDSLLSHESVTDNPGLAYPRNHFQFNILSEDVEEKIVLSECACSSSNRNFNRTNSSDRATIENNIIQSIRESFPNTDPEMVFNYFSFGSGESLQDFIIVGKLLLLGYSLNVILIEPDNTIAFYNALTGFSCLKSLADELGLAFSVRHFTQIRNYQEECPTEEIHISHSIDLSDYSEETIDDLVLWHQKLAVNGLAFLAHGPIDLIFDKMKCHKIEFYSSLDKDNEDKTYLFADNIPLVKPRIEQVENLLTELTTIQENQIIKNILAYRGGLFNLSLDVAKDETPDPNKKPEYCVIRHTS